MVVFTCNNCGETLQKPRVAKHYQFQCRSAPFLTCVDCFKDFRGEEYTGHTKCITEAERYGGKDYTPKPNANKGEKKQKEWLTIVNGLLDDTRLTPPERSFLQNLAKFDNIPRKKPKFFNFVTCAMGSRINKSLVEKVWDKMEAAQKENLSNTPKPPQANGHTKPGQNEQSNVVENKNNENIEKEENQACKAESSEVLNGHSNGKGETKKVKKQKKSKKRKLDELDLEETHELVKKVKSSALSESSNNQCEEAPVKSKFDWTNTILSVVQKKGELSMKKLEKRVLSQYMTHCAGIVTYEQASSKFSKKLKKVPGVEISDTRVKIV